jgi:hypothetical protein
MCCRSSTRGDVRSLSAIRLFALATAASVLFGVADLVFSWNPVAASPYLQNRHLPVFRSEPAFFFGLVAEGINGWIATLSFLLVEPALRGSVWRRGLSFGLMMWAFWVVSGTLSATVWLAVPSALAGMNVVFGLPKSLVIGCGVAWLWSRATWPRS